MRLYEEVKVVSTLRKDNAEEFFNIVKEKFSGFSTFKEKDGTFSIMQGRTMISFWLQRGNGNILVTIIGNGFTTSQFIDAPTNFVEIEYGYTFVNKDDFSFLTINRE